MNDASQGAGAGRARGTGRHSCFRFPRPASERCRPTPHHAFLTPSSERQVSAERGPPAASPRPAPAQSSASLRGLFSWWLRPRLPRDVSMCRFGRCGLRCGPRACSQRGGRVFATLPAAFLSGVPPSLSLLPQIAASCERAFSSAVPHAPLGDSPHSHRGAGLSSAGRPLPPCVRSGFGGFSSPTFDSCVL